MPSVIMSINMNSMHGAVLLGYEQPIEIIPTAIKPVEINVLLERELNAEEAGRVRSFLLGGLMKATRLTGLDHFTGALNLAMDGDITGKLHRADKRESSGLTLDSAYGLTVGKCLLALTERQPAYTNQAIEAWADRWHAFMDHAPVDGPTKAFVSGGMSSIFKEECAKPTLNTSGGQARSKAAADARYVMRRSKKGRHLRAV